MIQLERWSGTDRSAGAAIGQLILWLIGSIGAGVLIGLIVSGSILDLDLGAGYIDGRTLVMWEAEGRGPIHDVTITTSRVTNSAGDEGQLCRERACNFDNLATGNVITRATLAAGEVLTAPIGGVSGLRYPGIYQGRILIQSPDLDGGLLEVPVQITVHDFIVWPGLIILLGVVAGAYSRHLSETGRQKLDVRRRIEQVWQQWDDYMVHDRLVSVVDQAAPGNSIYDDKRSDLDKATHLLDLENEWGLEDAKGLVDSVEKQLISYQRLSNTIEAVRRSLPGEDTALRPGLAEADAALRRGQIEAALDWLTPVMRVRLPQLLEQVKITAQTVADDPKKKAIEALVAGAEKLCQQSSYLEAWKDYTEAEYQLLALGLHLPVTPVKGLAARDTTRERAGQLPASQQLSSFIQIQSARIHYRVGDTLPLRLVVRGREPRALVTIDWSVKSRDRVDDKAATFYPIKGTPLGAFVVFSKPGRWIIRAHAGDQLLAELMLPIDASGMVVLYRDKRLNEFNRQLVAGLLALIGGIIANRVLGFTFGSFEEYLAAFTWGVGVSYGVDQFSAGYSALKKAVDNLMPVPRSKAPPAVTDAKP